jgi:hypothetical protein
MPLGVIATTNSSDVTNATMNVSKNSNINNTNENKRAGGIAACGGGAGVDHYSNLENDSRRQNTQLYSNSNYNNNHSHDKGSSGSVLAHFTGACHQFGGLSSSTTATAKLLQSIEGCHQLGPLSSLAKKQIAKQRRVSFTAQDQIFEIPRFTDLTPEEFKAVYMTREEMSAIHDECWRLVDLMNQGVEWEDTPGFSKRGLVDLKDVSVERRRAMRDQAYKIVFGVQKFHGGSIASKGGGIRRPTDCVDVIEVTATLYSKAAARAQDEAYESAWYDAIAARVG